MSIDEELKQVDVKVQKAYHEGILKGWVKRKKLVINEKVMSDTLEGFGLKVMWITLTARLLQDLLLGWLVFLGAWTFFASLAISATLLLLAFYFLIRRTARVKNVYKLVKIVDKEQ